MVIADMLNPLIIILFSTVFFLIIKHTTPLYLLNFTDLSLWDQYILTSRLLCIALHTFLAEACCISKQQKSVTYLNNSGDFFHQSSRSPEA